MPDKIISCRLSLLQRKHSSTRSYAGSPEAARQEISQNIPLGENKDRASLLRQVLDQPEHKHYVKQREVARLGGRARARTSG